MTPKDITYIRNSFGCSNSGILKQLPMHIVASYDKQRGFAPGYGLNCPNKVAMRLIVGAARSSVDLLSEWIARGSELPEDTCLNTIMNSPHVVSSKFNVVFHINRSIMCKKQHYGLTDGHNKWLSCLNGSNSFHTKLFSNLSKNELSGNSLSFRFVYSLSPSFVSANLIA